MRFLIRIAILIHLLVLNHLNLNILKSFACDEFGNFLVGKQLGLLGDVVNESKHLFQLFTLGRMRRRQRDLRWNEGHVRWHWRLLVWRSVPLLWWHHFLKRMLVIQKVIVV